MKKKKQVSYELGQQDGCVLRDAPYVAEKPAEKAMIRTQIYLSRSQHEFVQAEATRRNTPMAEVIRGFIDSNMNIPEDAWATNPMLQAGDHEAAGPEDGSLNHDHYVYGAPKRFVKLGAQWIETPQLTDDKNA